MCLLGFPTPNGLRNAQKTMCVKASLRDSPLSNERFVAARNTLPLAQG